MRLRRWSMRLRRRREYHQWPALDGASSGVPPEALSDAGAALQRPELPLFVVVEKILGPHEPLPESWPVAGTTGYDFLKMCDGAVRRRGRLAPLNPRLSTHHRTNGPL